MFFCLPSGAESLTIEGGVDSLKTDECHSEPPLFNEGCDQAV